jgi:hypothetical protein
MLLSIQQSCNRRGLRWRWNRLVALGLVTAVLGTGAVSTVGAQSKDEKPADRVPAESPSQASSEKSAVEKLKEVERERDELKKRNADLELRLKQLQAAVDDQVHQALGETVPPHAFAFPPSGAMSTRQPVGPFISRFRPMFPPFNGMPDTVELAIAFSDALGEKETARPALEAAKQKVNLGHGATSFDVETASAQFARAERKVRLLRSMVTTSRDVAADEAERIRRLGAVHAVALAEVRNAEARLKMLDEILASDPDAVAKSSKVPPPPEPK